MARRTDPVEIATGRLIGSYDRAVAVFRGIPFARPPVGSLRWCPPQPAASWHETRVATKSSARAMQTMASFDEFIRLLVEGQGWGVVRSSMVKLLLKVAPMPPQSEDCLYLDLRTPALDRDARLPVMVWFHGGDHHDGSASDIFYDGSHLARRGVVVVYANYRLGLMGYLAHPALSRESEHGISGNYGTMDQIAALRWVRDNIEVFGGDPNNVTIFGESAGGESVAHMLTSPAAAGLFHRAILQSPANLGQMSFLRRAFANNPAAESAGEAFATRVLGRAHEDPIAALRAIAAEDLYRVCREAPALRHFYPVIDGHVLPKSPMEAFFDGSQARVPLLLGTNAAEESLLYPITRTPFRERAHEPDPPDVAALVREELEDDAALAFELYPGLREGRAHAQAALFGDSMFGTPVHLYARAAAQAGQPVYRYHFVRTPPSPRQTAGAYHAAEVSFVHGTHLPLFDRTPDDDMLTQAMGDYWVRFAKTGDPNVTPHPAWPRYSPEQPSVMQLGVRDELRAVEVPRLRQYEVLERRLVRIIHRMKA